MAVIRSAPNANTTITAMEAIFANKGVPNTCQSDNGPPFQSQELKDFAKRCGYFHHRITPEWPRANGMVERFNRSMKEAVQAAAIEGDPLRRAAQRFIQVYRATPHSATGVSPHSALYGGREMRTVFPLVNALDDVIDRSRDRHYKAKMLNGKLPHTFHVGDAVIVKQKKINKMTPAFNPLPLKITSIKGSMITACAIDSSWSITRDASYFRKIQCDVRTDDEEDDENDDIDSGSVPENPSGSTPFVDNGGPQINQPEPPPQQLPVPLRRSQRETRKPDYLKNYVC